MITIKDIAQISGYSISTVSRVINNRADVSDKAKETIEEVIRAQNYQPNENARMLKQNISSEISVIVRGNKSIFLDSVLEEIQLRMGDHGESINVHFIGETDDEVEKAVQIGQYLKPKGFIFLGGSADNFRKGFSRISLPSVLVTVDAEPLGYENLSSFTTDDEEAAGFAASELISQGHRRIGILGGYQKDIGRTSESDFSTLRIRGAVKALEKNGVPFDFEKDYEPSAFSAEGGYEAAGRLLQKSPDLTGVFAINDSTAIGAVRLFKDIGLHVPEDISVVGFNGVSLVRFFNPRLSSIRQDIAMLARKSVDDLLLRISYGSPAVHEKIPYEYFAGESVAPPCKYEQET